MLIFIWSVPQSKYGRALRRDLSSSSDEFEADVRAWEAGVGAVTMSRHKVAAHLSRLCMNIAKYGQCLCQCASPVPHAMGRNVLCWSHSQVQPSHKKRGFCLAKKFWTYLAVEFSFQIWCSRAQFERLCDLSPNVCRRWLISCSCKANSELLSLQTHL